VRPHDRYLMERFITAGVLVEGGQADRATIVDCKLKPAPDFRPVLKVVSLDIETSQHEALYSIALDGLPDRVVFMLGEPPPEPDRAVGRAEPMDFSLIYCPTRKAMIEKLNDWFEHNDPDVLIGWNVIQFDLRVLQKTANDCGVPLLLGRERRPIDWRTHPWQAGLPVRAHAGPRGHRRHRRAQGRGMELSFVQPRDRFAERCWAKARPSATSTTRWPRSSGATRKTSPRSRSTTSATANWSCASSTRRSCCSS
jgi:hypothetical protein